MIISINKGENLGQLRCNTLYTTYECVKPIYICMCVLCICMCVCVCVCVCMCVYTLYVYVYECATGPNPTDQTGAHSTQLGAHLEGDESRKKRGGDIVSTSWIFQKRGRRYQANVKSGIVFIIRRRLHFLGGENRYVVKVKVYIFVWEGRW